MKLGKFMIEADQRRKSFIKLKLHLARRPDCKSLYDSQDNRKRRCDKGESKEDPKLKTPRSNVEEVNLQSEDGTGTLVPDEDNDELTALEKEEEYYLKNDSVAKFQFNYNSVTTFSNDYPEMDVGGVPLSVAPGEGK